jgi:hypothetical protein
MPVKVTITWCDGKLNNDMGAIWYSSNHSEVDIVPNRALIFFFFFIQLSKFIITNGFKLCFLISFFFFTLFWEPCFWYFFTRKFPIHTYATRWQKNNHTLNIILSHDDTRSFKDQYFASRWQSSKFFFLVKKTLFF